MGGAYRMLNDALTLGLDTNFNLGAEYWFKEIIAIRAGYKTLTQDELKSSDLTFGAGLGGPGQGLDLIMPSVIMMN